MSEFDNDRLIIVAGLPFSGKSTFCRELSGADDRFQHYDIDEMYSLLYDGECIPGITEEVHRQLDRLKLQFAINNNHEMLVFAIEQLIYSSIIHSILEGGQHGDLDKHIPIIDGLYHQADRRKRFYEFLSKNLHFHDMFYKKFLARFSMWNRFSNFNKLLVYFDLGLENSLESFESSDRPAKTGMKITSDAIKRRAQEEELPKDEGVKNLEIVVVKNYSEIEAARERILEVFLNV